MLRPIQKKFKKEFRGRFCYEARNDQELAFGSYGIIAVTGGDLTAKQLEAGRKVLTKGVKKLGKVWIRVFPDYPRTRKPNEVRMGKGKGEVKVWVARVGMGKIIYEFDYVDRKRVPIVFNNLKDRLPLQIKLIDRWFYDLYGFDPIKEEDLLFR